MSLTQIELKRLHNAYHRSGGFPISYRLSDPEDELTLWGEMEDDHDSYVRAMVEHLVNVHNCDPEKIS